MAKNIELEVEGFGKVILEKEGTSYNVSDNNGNYMGTLDPTDIEDWTEDEYILSNIIADLIDDGTLDTSSNALDYDFALEYE